VGQSLDGRRILVTGGSWGIGIPRARGRALGDPARDLGPVLVFLAGDGAGFITGPVDRCRRQTEDARWLV